MKFVGNVTFYGDSLMNWLVKLLKLQHPCKFCKKDVWAYEWFCSDRCAALWFCGR